MRERQNHGRFLRRFLSYIRKRKDEQGEQGHWRLLFREMSEVGWEQVETETTLQDPKGAIEMATA